MALLIFTTLPDADSADRIAAVLVEESLAACCSVLGEVRSVYRWEGKVERAVEVQMIVKTTEELFEKACQRIRELHSYDVPEIIALPITHGLPEYLEWLSRSVGL